MHVYTVDRALAFLQHPHFKDEQSEAQREKQFTYDHRAGKVVSCLPTQLPQLSFFAPRGLSNTGEAASALTSLESAAHPARSHGGPKLPP